MGFIRPDRLPDIMVAPNGARRTQSDHPALPVTIEEIVSTARSCADAGAGAMHFHVRDNQQRHVLDAGLYKEALAALEHAVPEMHLQITTEAVGRYSPDEMRQLGRDVMPPGISVGIAEMIPSRTPQPEDIKFYQDMAEAGVKLQHICYQPEDIDLVASVIGTAGLSHDDVWCLFCIGHYTGRVSRAELIPPFLDAAAAHGLEVDWGICAFGPEEHDCLVEAVRLGGKLRVGFENCLLMADGRVAADNAERVRATKDLLSHRHSQQGAGHAEPA